ncbi:recombinase family protein [Schlesneria paludicola]|uniref:recombinase family protein n=1 Tax=Schlesneria paludicola TaxID=360056 RepID=UPI0009FFC1DB
MGDQQRSCREQAIRDGLRLPPEFELTDSEVSGTLRHGDGFDKSIFTAEAVVFRTLYVYSLSRLAKESVIGTALLRKLAFKETSSL